MPRAPVSPVLASSALAGVLGVFASAGALAAESAAPSAPGSAVAPSAADGGARARARYEAGTRAFAQGHFVEAALEFEAAADEKASATALYTAALSWERANVSERAADDYARALAMGGLATDATLQATDRLAMLEAALGTIVVSAPAGWRAQLDADTELPLPAALHGAPGAHTVRVRPLTGRLAPIPVVLKLGPAARLILPELVEDVSAAPVPARRDGDLRRTLGLVALGAAGAAFLGGALLGVEALAARDVYVAAPAQASYDHATSLQAWTDVAWIAGGTLTAAGLVLVFWPSPHPPATAARTPLRVGIGAANVFVRGEF